MSNCKGDGECFTQCECDCYDDNTEIYYDICICGHRKHKGYCPTNCCELIKCVNYDICKKKRPQRILNIHKGFCMGCHMLIGSYNITQHKEECPICEQNNNIVILDCNHKVCKKCWYIRCERNNHNCPICYKIDLPK